MRKQNCGDSVYPVTQMGGDDKMFSLRSLVPIGLAILLTNANPAPAQAFSFRNLVSSVVNAISNNYTDACANADSSGDSNSCNSADSCASACPVDSAQSGSGAYTGNDLAGTYEYSGDQYWGSFAGSQDGIGFTGNFNGTCRGGEYTICTAYGNFTGCYWGAYPMGPFQTHC